MLRHFLGNLPRPTSDRAEIGETLSPRRRETWDFQFLEIFVELRQCSATLGTGRKKIHEREARLKLCFHRNNTGFPGHNVKV